MGGYQSVAGNQLVSHFSTDPPPLPSSPLYLIKQKPGVIYYQLRTLLDAAEQFSFSAGMEQVLPHVVKPMCRRRSVTSTVRGGLHQDAGFLGQDRYLKDSGSMTRLSFFLSVRVDGIVYR